MPKYSIDVLEELDNILSRLEKLMDRYEDGSEEESGLLFAWAEIHELIPDDFKEAG